MRKPRFSLAFLLLVTTCVAVFLGYSQWRRKTILRQIDELKHLGGQVDDLPNGYVDLLWQRRPTSGSIRVYHLTSFRDDHEEMREQQQIALLKALGVTNMVTDMGLGLMDRKIMTPVAGKPQ